MKGIVAFVALTFAFATAAAAASMPEELVGEWMGLSEGAACGGFTIQKNGYWGREDEHAFDCKLKSVRKGRFPGRWDGTFVCSGWETMRNVTVRSVFEAADLPGKDAMLLARVWPWGEIGIRILERCKK